MNIINDNNKNNKTKIISGDVCFHLESYIILL